MQIEVRGRKFDVEVYENGYFHTVVNGRSVSAETLTKLKEDVTKITRASIDVPFLRYEGNGIMRGHVTGLHAVNGNYIIKFDGKKGVDQEYIYKSDTGSSFLRMSTDEEMAYLKLQETYDAAIKELRAFERAHSFDVIAEVKRAYADKESPDVAVSTPAGDAAPTPR